MIRPTIPADTPALLALTEGTGLFLPIDLEALDSVLTAYHDENADEGHRCVTLEDEGRVLGFAYYAPEAMTDRSWSLWWIAVLPGQQGRGLGRELLRYVEEAARAAEARVLFIDTSSLPHYEPTRRFYLKHGYAVTGVLSDFYADGDDKVIFRKRL